METRNVNYEIPGPRRYNINFQEICNWLGILMYDYGNWFLSKLNEFNRLYLQRVCNFQLTPSADSNSLEKISQTRDWKNATVRCIEFHPNCVMMAVVTNKDTVLIYDEKCGSPASLQSFQQKDIACASFRPWSQGCELAVGCSMGIFLWRQTRHSNGAHNIRHMMGPHNLEILQDEGHTYVTCLQWNEDGTILLSAALGSSNIVMWEPDRREKIHLFPVFSRVSSISLLRFSPDFLFCASCEEGGVFCLMNRSKPWKSEEVLQQGHIQTAVWTICSKYLLFAKEGDTQVYSLTNDAEASIFLCPKLNWIQETLIDLHVVTTCSGQQRICGEPQSFAMDPLGIYMAVLFKEQSFVLLCLLVNKRQGSLKILPIEFITCDAGGDQYPTCIGFGKSRKEDPEIRCLMIGWNMGHLQRYFVTTESLQETKKIHNIQFKGNPKERGTFYYK
ncbi:aladin [Drosophila ficusphila]|uniref:aladin n=1 Tax=Drosophila ficusphila TaxID=30025 RepID=UPI0007E70A34|nr:aladin [Drosophila ficusphila]